MNKIEQAIRDLVYGKANQGIPVDQIKMSCSTYIPSEMPGFNNWAMDNNVSVKYSSSERTKQ